MKSKWKLFTIALGGLAAMAALGQAPTPAPLQHGPGVQAANDSEYAAWTSAKCKAGTPPRGGGRGAGVGSGSGSGAGRGSGGGSAARGAVNNPNEPPPTRDYAVTEIPGVIAAGQKWKSIWKGTGNNADGIIASRDGGIMAAQNTDSAVMDIDKNGKVSFPYKDTNTGGALSMNKKGALFAASRGLPAAIIQLAPKRQVFANMYNGEPLDCVGGTLNDLTADSKGGVYFTMGGLFYANPKGVITKYGENLNTNGIILSPDEKTLYVTTRGLVAFDVQPDGSLTNQRQFAMVGGDGTTVDAAGRVYTTTGGEKGDVQVIAPDGKVLGAIPLPINFITVAFSGPDKKTLYGVANNQRFDEIYTIQMIAQGYKGRAK